MDIRRIPLWEGRNATYMSNDTVEACIEDQGEVCLELSNTCGLGGRVNPLSLPYFRGFGEGVESDANSEWWRRKQDIYQAGGSYFTFPFSSDEHINSNNMYWTVRKYGTEKEYGGVWRLSEMKSREAGNRYKLEKVDLMLPGHPVLYTAVRMTNLGDEELLCSPAHQSMLGAPFIESGCFIDTNARHFAAYGRSIREVAINRLSAGPMFDDLRRAPLADGGLTDASYIPGPTGTYDYILGHIMERRGIGWASIINPRLQMVYFTFTPSDMAERFQNVSITENYSGRMDSPWALWDGGTAQVFSVSLGFNYGPSGSRNFTLQPGEQKMLYWGDAFQRYENPRMNLGFYSCECLEKGVLMKRTKSSLFIPLDHSFTALKEVADYILNRKDEE